MENEFKLELKLEDPFVFEGKEYKSIDMSGLADLTLADNIAIERQLKVSGSDADYGMLHCSFIVAKLNKKPWDFCIKMRHRDAIRMQAMIKAFTFARASASLPEVKSEE